MNNYTITKRLFKRVALIKAVGYIINEIF